MIFSVQTEKGKMMFDNVEKETALREVYEEINKRLMILENYAKESISIAYDKGYKNAQVDKIVEMFAEVMRKTNL